MIELKTLHIASFDGNVGDNANHNGFYNLLRKNHPTFQFNIDEWEIREVFWKVRRFDSEFIKKANNYDLVIIGGGNFFELWVESSCNSTSIDIPIDVLCEITPPILFNALGVDPYQGVAKKGEFVDWMNFLFSNPSKYLVSVRNDGAISNIKRTFGDEFARKFHPVPDGGFFLEISEAKLLPTNNRRYIGINLAGDMLEGRFADTITPNEFIEKLSHLIQNISDDIEDVQFIFFPHIYRDLELINRVLSQLPDRFIRRKIQIAPYLHGMDSEKLLFKYYQQCTLVWANRFHANVCSIALNKPVIGLLNYPQIQNLYDELNAAEFVVDIRKEGFDSILKERTLEILESPNSVLEKLNKVNLDMNRQATNFHQVLNEWLPRK